MQLHNSSLSLACEYLSDRNRHVYITPTRFIELFRLFHGIMRRKHLEIDEERDKYMVGIDKLEEANVIVDKMKA